MGLFHKTIGDIKDLIEKGEIQQAAQVATDHFHAEHTLDSDMASLQRRIAMFHEHLVLLSRMRNYGKEEAEKLASEAESDIVIVKRLIKKLHKDGKLLT